MSAFRDSSFNWVCVGAASITHVASCIACAWLFLRLRWQKMPSGRTATLRFRSALSAKKNVPTLPFLLLHLAVADFGFSSSQLVRGYYFHLFAPHSGTSTDILCKLARAACHGFLFSSILVEISIERCFRGLLIDCK